MLFFLNHQIVYDEGPLYVFAKNEEVRSRWIKTLKDSQCSDSDVRFRLVLGERAREKFSLTSRHVSVLTCAQWCATTRTSCRSTIHVPGWTGSGCAATRRSNRPWAAGCWIIKMVRTGCGSGLTLQQSPNYLQHGPDISSLPGFTWNSHRRASRKPLPPTPTEVQTIAHP